MVEIRFPPQLYGRWWQKLQLEIFCVHLRNLIIINW